MGGSRGGATSIRLDSAGSRAQSSGAKLSVAISVVLETSGNFVCGGLGVPVRVEERSGGGGTEPRLVVACVPVDELVAVGCVEADLLRGILDQYSR